MLTKPAPAFCDASADERPTSPSPKPTGAERSSPGATWKYCGVRTARTASAKRVRSGGVAELTSWLPASSTCKEAPSANRLGAICAWTEICALTVVPRIVDVFHCDPAGFATCQGYWL